MCNDVINRMMGRTRALAGKPLENGGGPCVSPDPCVGAVIARGEKVIAEGFHARRGGLHAEAEALNRAGDAARGSELYCSLEPCSWEGPEKRQPPCTRIIIEAGIRRVVIGQLDPHVKMRGSGVRALRDAGIEVIVTDDPGCWRLNGEFNTATALERPFVRIKSAVTLDGRIAAKGGDSRWISSTTARREVHAMRAGADAVAVGINTVMTDDPKLTARLDSDADVPLFGRQPAAVVFDSTLRIPGSSYLLRHRAENLILVGSSRDGNGQWIRRSTELQSRGVIIIDASDLKDALTQLKKNGIRSLLVEGGASLITSFIRERVYDRITLYIAPLLLGEGLSLTGTMGITAVTDGVTFDAVTWRESGGNQVFDGWRAEWLDEVRSVCTESEVSGMDGEASHVYRTC